MLCISLMGCSFLPKKSVAVEVPVPTRMAIPPTLTDDCKGSPETTLESALLNRCSIIVCERLVNCMLRDWSQGGLGMCAPEESMTIRAMCET